ncbi:MAG: glycosyltransferase family 39 protein [Chloroflexi bacterium]|nr:glycosyltransferase family 39 protein [Chloroflexota bacterium]
MTVSALPRRAPARTRPAWIAEAVALAILTAALVPALLPLAAPGLPLTHDGFLHVQRLIALDQFWALGPLWSRWLPDLAYGFGQPLFLYYAPLAYAPAVAGRLLGIGVLASFEVTSALWLTASAIAMYLLARSLFSRPAALTAAIVYAVLPYQMVDLYVRGALAETAAFVWLPLVTFCLLRTMRNGYGRWAAGLALTLAALVLTHNITALMFLPAVLVLALLLLGGQRRAPRGTWATVPLALVAGVLLAGWYWWPALAERDLVQIGETIEPALFRSFFVRSWPPFNLDAAFDYRAPVSTALGSPIFWPQPGLVQVVTSALGALAVVRTRGVRRVVLGWAVLLVLGGWVLQLGPAEALFEAVPLAAFVQFPWRLLAVVGLGSALLAGGLVEGLTERPATRLLLTGLVAACSIWTAVARLSPDAVFPDERYLTAESLLRAEMADYGLGTTHSGEYLPLTSGQRNANRLRKSLLDDCPVLADPRAQRSATGQSGVGAPSVQPALQVDQLEWQPGDIAMQVTARGPQTLRVHQFAFPGWIASVDGVPAQPYPSGRFGVLTLDVPDGEHDVRITWGWTTPRLVGLGLSMLGALGLLGLLVLTRAPSIGWRWHGSRWAGSRWAGTRRHTAAGRDSGASEAARPWPDIRPARWLTLGGTVAGFFVLVSLAWALLGVRSPGWVSTRHRSVGTSLELLTVRTDPTRLTSDRVVTLTLEWLVRTPLPEGTRTALVVRAGNGDEHRVDWPSEALGRGWEANELVRTPLAIRLPSTFPAGRATLTLVVTNPAHPPDEVTIGQLMAPPSVGDSQSTTEGSLQVADGLTVAGRLHPAPGAAVRNSVRGGDTLVADLTWQATGASLDTSREYLSLLVLRGRGQNIQGESARPGAWFNPLPFWQAGDVVDQRLGLVVPVGLEPGQYEAVTLVYPRDLTAGGMVPPGADDARLRGRPAAELPLGAVEVTR